MAQEKKKITGRVIAFIIAVIAAISAFTIGIMQYAHRERGYYDVGVTTEGNAVLYDSGMHLIYYADGSSSVIRQSLSEVQKVYTDILLRYYRLLDARTVYDGITNIASLNAQPGQALAVEEDLFAVLSDALARHQQNVGFNLFSGALHAEWRALRYLDEPAGFDPLLNADEALLLSDIAAAVNGGYALSLELSAEARTAALHVDAGYAQWAQAQELDAPVLDLNLLHDAYLARLVARDLKQRGYTAGYLYTDSGVSIMLEQQGEMAYSLYGYADGPAVMGSVTLSSPSAFCQFTAFSPAGEKYGYYAVEDGGRVALRHAYVDARSGGFNDVLMSAALGAGADAVVDLACHLVALNALPDGAAVAAYVAALPEEIYAAYSLQSDAAMMRVSRE